MTELQLGEVTDEVAAFLEQMGRPIPEKVHLYTSPPARPRRQSRHIVHDPPHWRIALSPERRAFLREYDTLQVEVGERTAVGMHMQSDFLTYLTSMPAHVMVASNTQEVADV